MPYQLSLFSDNPEYDKFVEKFELKKTTDDCYTPPAVYEAIKDWACRRYGKGPESIVRPFYPGGDYESEAYPDGCFVLDNPPFSILSQIVAFFLHRKISFFLFAPTLTCLSGRNCLDVAHLVCDADITYENGAKVPTSFVTNCEPGVVLRSEPELGRLVNETCNALKNAVYHPKYIYPAHIVTAAIAQTYARRGVDFCVRREDCVPVGGLDSQKEAKKTIFGGGLLLSDRAAADRAAADRAAADRAAAIEWPLSARERAIIERMGKTLNI